MQNLVQRDVLLQDTLGILKDNSSYIKELNSSLSFPFVQDDYEISINLKKLDNFFNINYIFNSRTNFNSNIEFQEALQEQENSYEVSGLSMFEDMLFYVLNPKDNISGFNINVKNIALGKIHNLNHLKQLMKYYVNLTNNANIEKIPWQDFVFFADKEIKKGTNLFYIDIQYKVKQQSKKITFVYNISTNKMVKGTLNQ
jgi:hypothetical protein